MRASFPTENHLQSKFALTPIFVFVKPPHSPMSRLYPDPVREKPTPMEASSRFWCGAALGLLVGLVVSLNFFLDSAALFILAVTFAVVGCGALAVHYGDDFWDGVGRILSRFPWRWL